MNIYILFYTVISAPGGNPCETKVCEDWEHCVVVSSEATCFCTKPVNCPQADAGELVCGSDNREYESECHLKATSCFFRREITVRQRGECPDDGMCIQYVYNNGFQIQCI